MFLPCQKWSLSSDMLAQKSGAGQEEEMKFMVKFMV